MPGMHRRLRSRSIGPRQAARCVGVRAEASPGERLQAASKPLDQIVMAITKCLNAGADGELVHSGAESGEAVSSRPAQVCRSLASNCQTILNHRSLQEAQTLPAYPNGRGTLHCPRVDLACPDHLRRLCANGLWSGVSWPAFWPWIQRSDHRRCKGSNVRQKLTDRQDARGGDKPLQTNSSARLDSGTLDRQG